VRLLGLYRLIFEAAAALKVQNALVMDAIRNGPNSPLLARLKDKWSKNQLEMHDAAEVVGSLPHSRAAMQARERVFEADRCLHKEIWRLSGDKCLIFVLRVLSNHPNAPGRAWPEFTKLDIQNIMREHERYVTSILWKVDAVEVAKNLRRHVRKANARFVRAIRANPYL
jgi:DNA-binding GntR family transcriptional regulator